MLQDVDGYRGDENCEQVQTQHASEGVVFEVAFKDEAGIVFEAHHVRQSMGAVGVVNAEVLGELDEVQAADERQNYQQFVVVDAESGVEIRIGDRDVVALVPQEIIGEHQGQEEVEYQLGKEVGVAQFVRGLQVCLGELELEVGKDSQDAQAQLDHRVDKDDDENSLFVFIGEVVQVEQRQGLDDDHSFDDEGALANYLHSFEAPLAQRLVFDFIENVIS